jgi:hypothetical protein
MNEWMSGWTNHCIQHHTSFLITCTNNCCCNSSVSCGNEQMRKVKAIISNLSHLVGICPSLCQRNCWHNCLWSFWSNTGDCRYMWEIQPLAACRCKCYNSQGPGHSALLYDLPQAAPNTPAGPPSAHHVSSSSFPAPSQPLRPSHLPGLIQSHTGQLLAVFCEFS